MSLSLSVFYTRVIINGILVHYTFSAVPHTAFKLHLIIMLWTSLWGRSRDMNPAGTIHLSRLDAKIWFLRKELYFLRIQPLIKPKRLFSPHWILTVKTKNRKIISMHYFLNHLYPYIFYYIILVIHLILNLYVQLESKYCYSKLVHTNWHTRFILSSEHKHCDKHFLFIEYELCQNQKKKN